MGIGVRGEKPPTKVGVRKMRDMNQNPSPSGPALEQDRATQFGSATNKSPLTTGNANYKSPGSECGMS